MLAKYKTYIIIAAIIAALALTTWGVLNFTSLGKKVNDKIAEKKLGEVLDTEISKETVALTPANAEMYAQQLYTAMKGPGTDEDAIYSIFMNMTSRGDVLFLIKTFSVRGGLTLVEWITAELNSKERIKLNGILANKNINYTF